MLRPLEQFICDGCGQVIMRIKDGWVEWLRDDDFRCRGFRIVHHAPAMPKGHRCYAYDKHRDRADMSLRDFTGNTGLVRVYSLLHPGMLHSSDSDKFGIVNANEFATFLRRLTLPYFEEARQYFDQAMEDGFIGDANEVLVYTEDFLQDLIEKYARD